MNVQGWQGVAPGRLDVLGGVADYSGSLVLQMPIQATTRVTITPQEAPELRLTSDQEGAITLPLRELRPLAGLAEDAAALRAWLEEQRLPRWARYPLGCLLLFGRVQEWWPESGLALAITSTVPTSMGVSSSAALEVATLRALEMASGRRFRGTALARLGQRAENDVVGAPCGLMDQLAAAHGVPGALLPILCRPDILDEPVPLPEDVLVVGWPSGVRHTVSASPYATARTAAFLGKKILANHLSQPLAYLTELSPSQVRRVDEEVLPPLLSGRDFLRRHGQVDDPLSIIEPERMYPVRAAVHFPIEENFRATLAVQLLRGLQPPRRRATLEALGELMYQAHAGYNSIGLGCSETDRMVDAVRERGPEQGFYGARVSGGGSGGTVVVLLERTTLPQLQQLATTLTVSEAESLPLIL